MYAIFDCLLLLQLAGLSRHADEFDKMSEADQFMFKVSRYLQLFQQKIEIT